MNILAPKKFKILLLGDNCVDIYQFGSVDRISPEAPVPVFKLSREEQRPGMGGNVMQNLIALGCDVMFISDDILCKKTRLIDERFGQQLLRVDEDLPAKPLKPGILSNVDEFDAIIISDYAKGVVTYELVEWALTLGLPVFVDTKLKDLARFEGAFVKINHQEYKSIVSFCTDLIVTLGANGAEFKEKHYKTKPVQVLDVTGAGDTFLAALTYKYLKTRSIEKAIEFANKAASVTVQHLGVYAPSLKEIK